MDYGALTVSEYRKLHKEREEKYRIKENKINCAVEKYIPIMNPLQTQTDQITDVIQFTYGCSD